MKATDRYAQTLGYLNAKAMLVKIETDAKATPSMGSIVEWSVQEAVLRALEVMDELYQSKGEK